MSVPYSSFYVGRLQ